MAKGGVAEQVKTELLPYLQENGYELFRVEFKKEGKDWFLRIFIEYPWEEGGEKPPYIGTEDCEKVSRFLSERLDELDLIEQNYYLEVSSPGLDRPLLTERDYLRFAGEDIEVKLYEPMNGKKALAGRLLGLEEGKVLLDTGAGKGPLEIPREKVSKAKLTVVF
ncbi:MAG: ribosome maturation factor RimP [Bacillota bacterium]|nr:ribosome maturation factor RimP [Bacillota bacterium]